MKNTKIGPKVNALYIAAIDKYAARKEEILSNYLKGSEKVKKQAFKSYESAVESSDKKQAESAIKSL